MKSIYLRNFTVTTVLVLTCFLLVSFSFVSIGRIYLIREYKSTMDNSAQEVARAAEAISQSDSLSSWLLGMSISSLSKSTGNAILITDAEGIVWVVGQRLAQRAALTEHTHTVLLLQVQPCPAADAP